MKHFDELNLPPALKTALVSMNFSVPTPVQAQAIPVALEGRDVLATAMTGSGKTAFSIPMVARMLQNSRGSALIMLPTRELANQVETVIKQLLGPYSTIKSAPAHRRRIDAEAASATAHASAYHCRHARPYHRPPSTWQPNAT